MNFHHSHSVPEKREIWFSPRRESNLSNALGFELGGGRKSFSFLVPPFRPFFSTLSSSLLPPPDAHLFPTLKLPKDPFHVLYIRGGRGRRGQSKDEEGGGLVGGRSDPMCVYPHAFLPLSPSRKMGVDQLLINFWGTLPALSSPPPSFERGRRPCSAPPPCPAVGFWKARGEKGGGREGRNGADSTQSCNSRSPPPPPPPP